MSSSLSEFITNKDKSEILAKRLVVGFSIQPCQIGTAKVSLCVYIWGEAEPFYLDDYNSMEDALQYIESVNDSFKSLHGIGGDAQKNEFANSTAKGGQNL